MDDVTQRNPNLVILAQEHTRTLVIECPARCADNGCQDHAGHAWRKSRRLPQGTSVDYARTLMERHEQAYPKSGPYRLVEYVETSQRTMEVLT